VLTTGSDDVRRCGEKVDEGAVVGMSVELARIGEATMGEAMLAQGKTGVGHNRSKSEATGTERPHWEGRRAWMRGRVVGREG
jgi:hypothetical protein